MPSELSAIGSLADPLPRITAPLVATSGLPLASEASIVTVAGELLVSPMASCALDDMVGGEAGAGIDLRRARALDAAHLVITGGDQQADRGAAGVRDGRSVGGCRSAKSRDGAGQLKRSGAAHIGGHAAADAGAARRRGDLHRTGLTWRLLLLPSVGTPERVSVPPPVWLSTAPLPGIAPPAKATLPANVVFEA